jgi:hypothetical protein
MVMVAIALDPPREPSNSTSAAPTLPQTPSMTSLSHGQWEKSTIRYYLDLRE